MNGFLRALIAGQAVTGRHVVVTAHPDDETISFGGALSTLRDVRIVCLTTGVPARDVPQPHRAEELAAACAAAGWAWPIEACGVTGREAYLNVGALRIAVCEALTDVDVVWTHPYEGGHLDHDTAAWLVQRACQELGSSAPVRMEFASYHMVDDRRSAFGVFWPCGTEMGVARLTGERWARKQAAIAAYGSQAHILQKFPDPTAEWYRVAPVYDFTQPPPVPVVRWDRKGYQPSTATWRSAMQSAEVAA